MPDLKHSFASAAELDGQGLTTRSRSELFSAAVPPATVESLLHELRTAAAQPPARRELHLVALGGGYDAPDPDATSYAHRGQRFLLEHTGRERGPLGRSVVGTGPQPRLRSGLRQLPRPSARRWSAGHHGSHLHRLVGVKIAYDPDRFFDFDQAV